MGAQDFDPYFSHWADIAARRVLAIDPIEATTGGGVGI